MIGHHIHNHLLCHCRHGVIILFRKLTGLITEDECGLELFHGALAEVAFKTSSALAEVDWHRQHQNQMLILFILFIPSSKKWSSSLIWSRLNTICSRCKCRSLWRRSRRRKEPRWSQPRLLFSVTIGDSGDPVASTQHLRTDIHSMFSHFDLLLQFVNNYIKNICFRFSTTLRE